MGEGVPEVDGREGSNREVGSLANPLEGDEVDMATGTR